MKSSTIVVYVVSVFHKPITEGKRSFEAKWCGQRSERALKIGNVVTTICSTSLTSHTSIQETATQALSVIWHHKWLLSFSQLTSCQKSISIRGCMCVCMCVCVQCVSHSTPSYMPRITHCSINRVLHVSSIDSGIYILCMVSPVYIAVSWLSQLHPNSLKTI